MSRTMSRRSSRVERHAPSQLPSQLSSQLSGRLHNLPSRIRNRVRNRLRNGLRRSGPSTSRGASRRPRGYRRAQLARFVQPSWSGRSTRSKIAIAGLGLLLAVVAIALARRAVRRLATRQAGRDHEKRGLDTLTGLPNRAEAIWWLNLRLQRARSRSHRLALMILDLNDFAGCNDLHGRAAGDHVLQVTATRMQAQLRTGDIICRTGSDTFLVIMDAVGPDHLVAKVGERIVTAVAEPISYHGDPVQVTASVGFALSKEHEQSYELLLDRAERALIQAKAAGRSIVQF